MSFATARNWFQCSAPQSDDSLARAGTLGVLAAGLTAILVFLM